MPRITWDDVGKRLYEAGVSNVVLYVRDQGKYTKGVPWNGITGIDENPSGAEPQPYYADNIKYLNIISAEEFSATISAFTYPDEFEACDGSIDIKPGVKIGQQNRKTFGLCYRTEVGNDDKGNDYGYKLHLIYGCLASPSAKGYKTVGDNTEPIDFSWEVKTTPVKVTGHKPTATLELDSTVVSQSDMKKIEDKLYGESGNPELPLPDEIAALITGSMGA